MYGYIKQHDKKDGQDIIYLLDIEKFERIRRSLGLDKNAEFIEVVNAELIGGVSYNFTMKNGTKFLMAGDAFISIIVPKIKRVPKLGSMSKLILEEMWATKTPWSDVELITYCQEEIGIKKNREQISNLLFGLKEQELIEMNENTIQLTDFGREIGRVLIEGRKNIQTIHCELCSETRPKAGYVGTLEVCSECLDKRKKGSPTPPPKKEEDKFETDDNYWDCECKEDYIHPKSQDKCQKCLWKKENAPDSMATEVKAMEDRQRATEVEEILSEDLEAAAEKHDQLSRANESLGDAILRVANTLDEPFQRSDVLQALNKEILWQHVDITAVSKEMHDLVDEEGQLFHDPQNGFRVTMRDPTPKLCEMCKERPATVNDALCDHCANEDCQCADCKTKAQDENDKPAEAEPKENKSLSDMADMF